MKPVCPPHGVVRKSIAGGRHYAATEAFVDFWSGGGTYASMPLQARAGIARNIDKVLLDFQAAWGWRLDGVALESIVAPTLVLAGKRSPPVAHRVVARLASSIPRCRSALFNTGHMGPVTDPEPINASLVAFVRRCASTTQTTGRTNETNRPVAKSMLEVSAQ